MQIKRTAIVILILTAMLLASCGVLPHPDAPQSEAAPKTDALQTGSPDAAAQLEAGIAGINKYGNITLTIGPQTMQKLGYEPADIILVKIGGIETEMPIGTAYSDVDSGEPVCVFKADPEGGEGYVILAINSGNLAAALKIAEVRSIDADPGYEIIMADGFDETTTVYLSILKKQGYAEEYRMHQLAGVRTNKRQDYANLSDAEYANFRAVNTTGMGIGTLYRSSSPVNPALNRNKEADAMVLDSLIRTIVNMADQEETMKAYPDYPATNYSKCDIIALNMGMDFQSEAFGEKLARGFRYMASHEGPYLIHCNEGKDRTGFAVGILECLMGADADEIVQDYMLTYYNFYGIESGTEQYTQIADSNIKATLAKAFGSTLNLSEIPSLAECASDYLKGLGMTAEEISSLKNNLGKAYGGLTDDENPGL